MESDTFYGGSVVKLIWRLSDNLIYHVFFKENPRQSPDWFYHKISIKSITLYTVSIQSPYYHFGN